MAKSLFGCSRLDQRRRISVWLSSTGHSHLEATAFLEEMLFEKHLQRIQVVVKVLEVL